MLVFTSGVLVVMCRKFYGFYVLLKDCLPSYLMNQVLNWYVSLT